MANIHILGVKGAGKTVFVSVLAQRFRQLRDGCPHLVFNDAETNFYVSDVWETLTQKRKWPAPTEQSKRLSWTLCTADGREHNLTFWDTHEAQDLGSLRESLRSDMAILLVDLLEIVGLSGGARADLESSIVLTLKTLLANGKPLAVLLSKYDLLKKYIEQHREDITFQFVDEKEPEMVALEVLRRWFPEAYVNLKNASKRTYVGFVSSVADTEKRVGADVHNNNIDNSQVELNESAEGGEKVFPRENFTSYGFDELMSWITTSLTIIARKRRLNFWLWITTLIAALAGCCFAVWECAVADWVYESRSATQEIVEPPPPKSIELSPDAGATIFTVPLDNTISMDFVGAPAGTFMMGSPDAEEGRYDDESRVRVRISEPFYLGKTEVTQVQWKAVMGSNPSYFKGDNLPVECVSWDEAMEFCRKLTEREHSAGRLPRGWKYTLPTEAQWEYACRAGTTTRFSFGNSDKELYRYGNFYDCSGDTKYDAAFREKNGWEFLPDTSQDDGFVETAPVGRLRPNAWGLYDMHGNVWEWCLDYYNPRLAGGENPIRTTPGSGEYGSVRVFRGGGWLDYALRCRSANRIYASPDDRGSGLGFRVALVRE